MPFVFLPDSSVIVNGKILDFIKDGTLDKYTPITRENISQTEVLTIILSRVMLAELENQANQTKSRENLGLQILHELYGLSQQNMIILKTVGTRPTLEQIRLNYGGELDALIRRDALASKAILITADEVQSSIALVEGIDVLFTMNLPNFDSDEQLQEPEEPTALIESYFDDKTMSVHLRAHCVPIAKRGKPGDWKLEPITEEIMEPHLVAEIGAKIITQAKNDDQSFIEKNEPGVSVIQLRNYRIVICRPPFSNTHEITAVRPLVSLTLDDYYLPEKIYERLEIAEGVLVAGSPGAGKSTFISALVHFYLKKQKLVKTLESVRDLDVPPEVAQYAPLEGSLEKTADILLLIRPDFTIFDEVRTESDFKIFGDLRLAGVGLVGVVHASRAVDAVQRFIRRVELGVIPNVVDTIIFIDKGQVAEILSLEMTVKKPTGFTDRDLSRPVIEVRDFMDNELLYEIYAFGSDVIVARVSRRKQKPISKRYLKNRSALETYDKDAKDEHEELYEYDDNSEPSNHSKLIVKVYRKNKSIVLSLEPFMRNKYVNFYVKNKFLFSATLNKMGEASIRVKSPVYGKLQKIIRDGVRITASEE